MAAKKSQFTLGTAMLWLTANDSELRAALEKNDKDSLKALNKIADNVGGALMKFNIVFEALENGLKLVQGIWDEMLGAVKEFAKASVEKFAETGDALDEMRAKTGITSDALSELLYAGKFSSIDQSGLATALKKLAQFLEQVKAGAQPAMDALAGLGLTPAGIAGMKTFEDRFIALGAAVAKLTDDEKKANLATVLFGKTGTEILPMFDDGIEKIQSLRAEARSLNIVYSDSMAKDASRLADAWDRAGSALDGVKIQFGSMLAGTYEWAANVVTEVLKSVSGAFADVAPNVRENAQGLLDDLEGIGEALRPAMDKMAEWIGNIIEKVQNWIKVLTPDFKKAITALSQEIDKFLGNNKETVTGPLEASLIDTTNLAGHALEVAEKANARIRANWEAESQAMSAADQAHEALIEGAQANRSARFAALTAEASEHASTLSILFDNYFGQFGDTVDKTEVLASKSTEDIVQRFNEAFIRTSDLQGAALMSALVANDNSIRSTFSNVRSEIFNTDTQLRTLARTQAQYGADAVNGVTKTTETNENTLAAFGKRVFSGLWDTVAPIYVDIFRLLTDTFTITMKAFSDIIATEDWEKDFKSLNDFLSKAFTDNDAAFNAGKALGAAIAKGAWNGLVNSDFIHFLQKYSPTGWMMSFMGWAEGNVENAVDWLDATSPWNDYDPNHPPAMFGPSNSGPSQAPAQSTTHNVGPMHVGGIYINGAQSPEATGAAVQRALVKLEKERRGGGAGYGAGFAY